MIRKGFLNQAFPTLPWGISTSLRISQSLRMAWCGSPEPLDKTETGRHGIIYGEISETSLRITNLEFIPMAKLQYIPLMVDVTPRHHQHRAVPANVPGNRKTRV